MSANDIPDRVSADLNRRLRLVDKADQRKFDPWDLPLMHELFGERIGSPLATLLIALEQIEQTEKSFGPDKSKAFDFIRPHLTTLKDACQEEFRQL